MKFRVIKKPMGWVVQEEVSKWSLFGLKKVWIPYVKSSGLDSEWYHSSREFAFMNLVSEINKTISEMKYDN